MDMTAEPAEKIIALPAQTIDGLKAKARLALFACGTKQWNGPPEDMDWDQRVMKALVNAVLAFEAVQA